MKVKHHILFLLFFWIVSFSSLSQWERMNQFSGIDTLFLKDIHFFDADTGFAVATKSTSSPNTLWGYLMRTNDGAQSWDTLFIMSDSVTYAMDFPTRDVGYVTYVDYPVSGLIGILKTTNGGDNWNVLSTNGINITGVEIGIHFYDEYIGIMSVNGNSLITYDGGYNWNQLNTIGNPQLDVFDNFVLMASGNGFGYSYDTINTYGITSFLNNASINNQDVNIIEGDTMLYVTASGNSGPSFGYPYFNFGVIGIHNINSGESGVHHFPFQYTRCITRTNNYIYSGNYDTEDGTHRFLKSEDGGYTWWSQQIIETETPNTLGVRKIVCVNDAVCYGMDGSYLYKTTNGGGPLMELKGLHYSNVEENHMGNDELKIYPNPATDVVHIQSTQKIKQIQVLDLSGKVLLIVNSGDSFLDISHLSNGIYLLQLKTESGTVVRKLVKE